MLDEIERVVVGRRSSLQLVLLGILGRGHVLLEDVPGLGKTMMARSFSEALGLSFARVQFTPDLLPADLTGLSVYDPATTSFEFRPGPVFTQLLLADEINRTPPKTQAALLEAMAEEQVTSDGETRPLPQPFVVLATDNPIEYEGTYALPEAQLDRFLLRVSLGYLDLADEQELLRRRVEESWTPPRLRPIVDAETVLAMRASLDDVQVEPPLLAYVVAIVDATRQHAQVTVGASPRGGLALVALARGHAVLDGRDYVTPEDVKAVAVAALAHRLSLRPELWVRRITGADVVAEILATVPAPR
ncbi:MAG TPA: MoxR family ATPase [Actinomycetes bacterium]|nr:MoxR family ATPase [Actinomycetes bacterium]